MNRHEMYRASSAANGVSTYACLSCSRVIYFRADPYYYHVVEAGNAEATHVWANGVVVGSIRVFVDDDADQGLIDAINDLDFGSDP